MEHLGVLVHRLQHLLDKVRLHHLSLGGSKWYFFIWQFFVRLVRRYNKARAHFVNVCHIPTQSHINTRPADRLIEIYTVSACVKYCAGSVASLCVLPWRCLGLCFSSSAFSRALYRIRHNWWRWRSVTRILCDLVVNTPLLYCWFLRGNWM